MFSKGFLSFILHNSDLSPAIAKNLKELVYGGKQININACVQHKNNPHYVFDRQRVYISADGGIIQR